MGKGIAVMYFNDMHSFLSMGGYGAYVWGAYLFVLVFLVGGIYLARRSSPFLTFPRRGKE